MSTAEVQIIFLIIAAFTMLRISASRGSAVCVRNPIRGRSVLGRPRAVTNTRKRPSSGAWIMRKSVGSIWCEGTNVEPTLDCV
jgi:hypothetical protein